MSNKFPYQLKLASFTPSELYLKLLMFCIKCVQTVSTITRKKLNFVSFFRIRVRVLTCHAYIRKDDIKQRKLFQHCATPVKLETIYS